MKFVDATAIFDQISHTTKDLEMRKLGVNARQKSYENAMPLQKAAFDDKLTKLAFDTRRIDQVNDRNPRGNLQYYHRSEPFIDDDLSGKISRYMKVKSAVDLIKDQYGTDPEWFDSYARVLSSAVDRALRTEQKDGDFFKAAFDYLDELLYVRYRLSTEDIVRMSENEIEKVVLGKDEKMTMKHFYKTTSKPVQENNDPLVERLLNGVKATADNQDVERSLTLTIRDKINTVKTGDKS